MKRSTLVVVVVGLLVLILPIIGVNRDQKVLECQAVEFGLNTEGAHWYATQALTDERYGREVQTMANFAREYPSTVIQGTPAWNALTAKQKKTWSVRHPNWR